MSRRPADSGMPLTSSKSAKININNHLRTLSDDNFFITADYAFSTLETIRFSFNQLYMYMHTL